METEVAVNWAAVIIGAVAMGAIVGTIPFVLGNNRGHKTLGMVCLVLCILGNFIAGLFLSVPICLVSVIVILCMKKQ